MLSTAERGVSPGQMRMGWGSNELRRHARGVRAERLQLCCVYKLEVAVSHNGRGQLLCHTMVEVHPTAKAGKRVALGAPPT